MFGDRFSSSTSCSRGVHETEPDRPDQSLTCCFLKVATHPFERMVTEIMKSEATNGLNRTGDPLRR